jgi:hypothetical protein
MAKKLYAVTNIKLSADKTYQAGEEVDTGEIKELLSKDQIKELFDAGALEMKDPDMDEEVEAPKVTAVDELDDAPAPAPAPAVEEEAPAEDGEPTVPDTEMESSSEPNE